MLGLEEDRIMAKERLKAWWDHEIIDRPVIQFSYPKLLYGWRGSPDYWALIKPGATIKTVFDDFEKKIKGRFFGGERLPTFNLNYGPGALGETLGVEPKFANETVWYKKKMPPEDLIDYLETIEYNKSNTWYYRFLTELEYVARRAGKKYAIGIPSFGGVIDTLQFFLDFSTIVVKMRRDPEFIDTCRRLIQKKLIQLIEDCNAAVLNHSDGVSNWLRIWGSKDWYVLQEDMAYNLSPKYFKRFVLPDIIEQTESMEYSIYHLDGVNQLKHLDDLLEIPTLTGIQWVPGVQEKSPGSLKWLPYFKKIQKAGKNIVIGAAPEELRPIYKNLDPNGLLVSTGFPHVFSAKKHLPEFMFN